MNMFNRWGRLLKTRQGKKNFAELQDKIIRKRMFFALCPDEYTRQALTAAQESFPRQLSDYWIRPANLHVTLVHLGGVKAESLDNLKEAASVVRVPTFELSLDRLTYWPHKHILCLTPSVVPPALEKLVDDLGLSLEALGQNVEKRNYRAYTTLAREASYPPPHIQLEQSIRWNITSFALLESRPDGLDVAHSIVQTWPLLKLEGSAELTDVKH